MILSAVRSPIRAAIGLESGAEPPLEVQEISGAQSGTLTKKRYRVIGDLTVTTGTTCVVEAGSIFEFVGTYSWTAVGGLELNGTASEPIQLKPSDDNVSGWWRGVRCCTDGGLFTVSGPDSGADFIFTYCQFSFAEKLDQTTGNYHRIRGAALFCYLYDAITTIDNCTFTDCSGYDYGGTVYLDQIGTATTTFSNCLFTRCVTTNETAGAWVVTHSTYAISGMTYVDCEGQVSGGTYGQNATYSVDTGTDQINMGGTHYMITGNIVKFLTTANAPAPCVGGVEYYAIIVSGSVIKLATTYENANAGTAINLTAGPTGTAICNTLQEFSAFDSTVVITT